MKMLTLLKTMTALMALIIIVGTTLVVYKVADLKQKSKPAPLIQSEFLLAFPETIENMTPCGDRLCLMTAGHQKGRRLIIVDPTAGKIKTIITFKEQMN